MPEGVERRLGVGRDGQADDIGPLGDGDDAEGLALPMAGVEVVHDLVQFDLELRNDDHVGPSGEAPHQRHPPGVSSHRLDHHHPVV